MRQGNSARWATGNEDLGAEVDADLRSFVRASEMRLDAEVEATDAGWPPQEMPDGFEFGLGEESQPASESHTRRVLTRRFKASAGTRSVPSYPRATNQTELVARHSSFFHIRQLPSSSDVIVQQTPSQTSLSRLASAKSTACCALIVLPLHLRESGEEQTRDRHETRGEYGRTQYTPGDMKITQFHRCHDPVQTKTRDWWKNQQRDITNKSF